LKYLTASIATGAWLGRVLNSGQSNTDSIPCRIEIGGECSLTTKIALLIEDTIILHDFEQDAKISIHDVGFILGLGKSFFVNGRKIVMMIAVLDMLGTEG
jgi:hypothetical protein